MNSMAVREVPLKTHKQWARPNKRRMHAATNRDEVSEKISRLADAKSVYYEQKLELKRKQFELFELEHNAKMEVYKLQKKYYTDKLVSED
jgi:hypothetical protein